MSYLAKLRHYSLISFSNPIWIFSVYVTLFKLGFVTFLDDDSYQINSLYFVSALYLIGYIRFRFWFYYAQQKKADIDELEFLKIFSAVHKYTIPNLLIFVVFLFPVEGSVAGSIYLPVVLVAMMIYTPVLLHLYLKLIKELGRA